MKIKVGDYARTHYGISKIKRIIPMTNLGNDNILQIETEDVLFDGYEGYGYFTSDEIKSSPNIIDLIEVGDYVNGQLVMEIYEKNSIYNGSLDYKFKERTLELFNTDYECIPHEFLINNKRIESILTKEQFSQMEYKIER